MSRVIKLSSILLISLFVLKIVHSAPVNNQSSQCADVLMLFARGSSSNPSGLNIDRPFSDDFENGVDDPNNPGKKIGAEEIPGAFFRWMETRIKADFKHIDYKAISVHNSGKGYSINGYPAVGIFDFNPFQQNFHNMLNAEISWWPAGMYRDSVDSGAHELAGIVNDETNRCPAQRIVVGGYSQGAHVVHEALKIIPQNQRNMIDNAVLFGDPKFIGAEYNKYNPLSKVTPYPWHRGTAGYRERGLADAEIPYVPDDMIYKTISWCHEDDFVCTGMSGLGWSIQTHGMPSNTNSIWSAPKNALGDGHMRYPVFGVPEATAEVANNLRPYLKALEISRGGIDPAKDAYKVSYSGSTTDEQPIDLMFAFNKTSGIDDAYFQYSFKLKDILKNYKKYYPNITTGSVMYTDMGGGSGADKSYVSAYTQSPNQLSTNVDSMFNYSPIIFGGLGGGGDYPENHGMAIERAGMFAGWRQDARKHIVIFAERPATEQWSFNMCDSFVMSQFPLSLPNRCVTGSNFITSSQSVYCESAIELSMGSQCPYRGVTSQSYIISRTLEDEIKLAKAKGFVVDVIQPHTARSGISGWDPDKVGTQLKNLAESSGGLYLKYDVFDEPAMRDAIWRILAHHPNLNSNIAYISGTNLSFDETKQATPTLSPYISLQKDISTLLAISPVANARYYEWDTNSDGVTDITTNAPSTPISSPDAIGTTRFVRVQAYDVGGTKITANYIPVQVVGGANNVTYAPTYSEQELAISLVREPDSVSILWNGDVFKDGDYVLLIDPYTGMPITSTPAKSGSLNIDVVGLDQVYLRASYGEIEGPVQVIDIPDYIGPPTTQPIETPQETYNPQTTEDPGTVEEQSNELEVEEVVPPEVVVENPGSNTGTETENSPPIVDENIQSDDRVDPIIVTDTLGDVGLTDDKNVTQKEPNSSFVLVRTSTQPPQTAVLSATQVNSQTTIVASAQDIKTNPQDKIGGINEVNQLFKGEDIGSEPIEPEKKTNIPTIILAVVIVLSGSVASMLYLVAHKKQK